MLRKTDEEMTDEEITSIRNHSSCRDRVPMMGMSK